MDDWLFADKDLGALIRSYPDAIRNIVESWDKNKVLGASENDLIEFLVAETTLDVPELLPREHWSVSSNEANIDVSHDYRYNAFGDRHIEIVGQRIVVEIPFEGDADLFAFRPSTRSSMQPRGRVSTNPPRLSFTIQGHQLSGEDVKQRIDRNVEGVNEHIAWCRRDCEAWNSRAREKATKHFRQRKTRLLEQDELVGQLGIRLKMHDEPYTAISVPVVRKKRPAVRVPDTPRGAFKPEPAVLEEDYEDILQTVANLSMSIERSPTAFHGMAEEHIRDHILVSLNGVYEGNATGETFNSTGKTDILIREHGGNVFIAECKIWRGAKALHAAIDQLLGYVTWRDTKTALIVFSKNKDFTNVLGGISEAVLTHPNHTRHMRVVDETQSRHVFKQTKDVHRDVHLAVLAFDIPPPLR